MKSFTALELIDVIRNNQQESRRELFLHQFKYFGNKSKDADMQFWNHENHPFYLYTNEMIEQKVNYIHNNPVVAGFVSDPAAWRLSSANPESPIKVESL